MTWTYKVDWLAKILGTNRPGDDTPFHRVSTDTRTIQPGDVFFALKGERFDGHDFVIEAFHKGAAAAVVEHYYNKVGPCLVVPNTLEALQQFAAHHRRQFTAAVIAITGSCGKTTSKDLVAALLETKYQTVKTKGNSNNEIGCPLSLLQMDGHTERVVLEMGANHKGEIARLCRIAKPDEAAITLIAPAHLEGFGSIEDVAEAKGEILSLLPARGAFYVNTDDPRCVKIAERYAGTKVRFGSEGDVALKSWRFDDDGRMVLDAHPVGTLRLPLRARAHITNVLLAIAVGLRHGIEEFEGPLADACAASTRFKLLRIGPIEVIDDTYNANPASVRAALEALAEHPGNGRRIAALGDMLELGDEAEHYHAEAGRTAARLGIAYVFARGHYAEALVEAARRRGAGRAEAFHSHDDIARAIVEIAKPGDIVLVKGSRGMTMEKVIESLRELYGTG